MLIKKLNGLSFGKNEDKMGWKNQPLEQLLLIIVLRQLVILVGTEGDGFKIAMQGLDGGRINIASCSLGAARFCIDSCIKYVN